MGNRASFTRSAAGTDHAKETGCKNLNSRSTNEITSSVNGSKMNTSSTEMSNTSSDDLGQRRGFRFSTVSPSETTGTCQSKLLTPLGGQSTPFRFPNKKAENTTDSDDVEGSEGDNYLS
ncbi:hypothetical protein KIN20_003904 [Parelaphostrongylus tenuis]|uniref:Uncharacterized protein n=1 Tax=Parelaphostrongylus tenuis TaxID=148309 RepID=A0AAD5LXK7_PARTN|nr:hypothetical protein KIN20_003904 [Parelaphostrongylus tenuis]